MYAIETFANDSFSYSANVSLSNNMTWTVNSHCINLDFNKILDSSNSDIGFLSTTLSPIVTTTPNSINYTYTMTALPSQTKNLGLNGINPAERVVIIQTKFTSNTGLTFNVDDLYLRIKNNIL